jgi:hypothetical protein
LPRNPVHKFIIRIRSSNTFIPIHTFNILRKFSINLFISHFNSSDFRSFTRNKHYPKSSIRISTLFINTFLISFLRNSYFRTRLLNISSPTFRILTNSKLKPKMSTLTPETFKALVDQIVSRRYFLSSEEGSALRREDRKMYNEYFSVYYDIELSDLLNLLLLQGNRLDVDGPIARRLLQRLKILIQDLDSFRSTR